jgi:putative ABC transport system permease protein
MEYLLPLYPLVRRLETSVGPKAATLIVIGAAFSVVIVLLLLARVLFANYTTFVLKSMRRNFLRTTLACLAVMVLTFVVTLVWSFLVPLEWAMTEKAKDFKMIVTERLQVPSQMPLAYQNPLEDRVAKEDSMTWSFYGGFTDKEKKTFDNIIFFFVMDPTKLKTMMDELESLDQKYVDAMVNNRKGCIIGKDRLKKMNKRVGEQFTVTSLNYKDIDLEFDIVGTFPDNARYNQSAVMNREYLYEALEQYNTKNRPKRHPMSDKPLNLVWLRVPDSDAFAHIGNEIMSSPEFTAPFIKAETQASGISTWLEPYRDILNGVKYGLVPSLLVIMSLVMAMAISINVRERRTEMAVLKVLGFTPARVMAIVLGEALLIGTSAGLLSAALSYGLVHGVMGGIGFPIAFFPVFDIFPDAFWWGPALGCLTTLAGSIVPALSARKVKVSEVFAKIA